MATDNQDLVFEYPEKEVSWLTRDVLLFHISIGINADDLEYLYELHPKFEVFPTFATILAYKGTCNDIILFESLSKPTDLSIPGIPTLDRSRVVDGQKRIIVHRRLPTNSSGRRFVLRQSLLGVYDKGERVGTIIDTVTRLVDLQTDEVFVSVIGSVVARGQGGWGGIKGPPTPSYPVPSDRQPDFIQTNETRAETPLLYRLNGDYNPLHAEPTQGQSMGFGGTIIHGLFTWSMAAYAVVHAVGLDQTNTHSASSSLKDFQARFAAPVFPGDKLQTQVWRISGEGEEGCKVSKNGVQEFRFNVIDQRGRTVLSNGVAVFRTENDREARI